jgi:uncharacterized OB-fold protein
VSAAELRAGTHSEPPPRLPGESFEDWLSACQTAIVLLPERTSVDPRAETVKEPAVRPGRVCALDGCGIVFTPRAATQQCCSRPHREALARAEGRKSQRQPTEQNRAAQRFMGQAASVPKLTTTRKPQRTTITRPSSPRARAEGQRQRLADMRCEPCGTVFHPRRATTRFCSVACRIAATRSTPELMRAAMDAATEARRLPLVPCPVCGTPFAPVRAGKHGRVRVTCSVACGQVSRERKLRRVPRAACPICEREVARYVTRRPNQTPRTRTYCSWACFQTALAPRQVAS